jgi:hypothetical protein
MRMRHCHRWWRRAVNPDSVVRSAAVAPRRAVIAPTARCGYRAPSWLIQLELPVPSFRPAMLALAVASILLAGNVCAAAAAADGCGSQAAVPADKRLSNTAHWTTASEEENFGYDVYRGDVEKGPFVKLTKQPVLGNGTTNETHKYQYVDDSIDPCRDYWYYVESIASDGRREKFTTVFRAPAKRHAGEGSAKPPAQK